MPVMASFKPLLPAFPSALHCSRLVRGFRQLRSCSFSIDLTSSCRSFPSKTGCFHSSPFAPFLRSNFSNQSSAKGIHSARMASNATTVPSIVVYVTVPNKEAGKKLAESIIKEKLAACVNRVPGIESVYWWDNQIQTDAEELLIIKTRESLLEALTAHVKENHEYECPEVISLPITGGNLQYLEWLKANTRDPSQ